MKFSLIDNGADSLKKAKLSIDSFKESEEKYSYYYIKDATIFLNQAVEVLLKYILSTKNESLIFKDIKKYIDAKKELFTNYSGPVKVEKGFGVYPNSRYTVFDIPKGKNLETIGLTEAIERVKFLCDIEMSDEFVGAIQNINKYRNKLMHHSITIYSRTELNQYIIKLEFLYESALDFFEIHIPGITEKVDLQRFEIRKEEWEELQREMSAYYEEVAMSKIISDDMY